DLGVLHFVEAGLNDEATVSIRTAITLGGGISHAAQEFEPGNLLKTAMVRRRQPQRQHRHHHNCFEPLHAITDTDFLYRFNFLIGCLRRSLNACRSRLSRPATFLIVLWQLALACRSLVSAPTRDGRTQNTRRS